MPSNTPDSMRLVLSDADGLGRLEVDLESFFALSFELAEDLEDLVQSHRWTSRRRETEVRVSARSPRR